MRRSNMLHRVDIDDKRTYMANPYPRGWSKSTVPPGASGDWAVERFTVTEARVGLFNLRLIRDGYPERVVPPGEYTKLVRNGGVIMSDTPAEAREHHDAWCNATGAVLVNGLGIGFYLENILKKPDVAAVTVIEKSPDVIKLVGPTFAAEARVTIIEADALEWRPAKNIRYDYVWHDIWTDICGDNKSEMRRLRRAYSRHTKYQGCWSADYL